MKRKVEFVMSARRLEIKRRRVKPREMIVNIVVSWQEGVSVLERTVSTRYKWTHDNYGHVTWTIRNVAVVWKVDG